MPFRHLRGHFPPRSGAYPYEVGGRDRAPSLTAEATVVIDPPQNDVSIQQHLQNSSSSFLLHSNAASSSFVIGASKSGDIQILPLRRPGFRLIAPLNATSFAIGLPFLAMMISSPAAAIST